jgi:serine/threonine protein kinase
MFSIDLIPLGYRWLYEKAGVLHRDISLYNLMFYRERNNLELEVCGVLNDYDLATVVGVNESPSSMQRTGTRPYMAYELLDKNPPRHSYRHDLESLFYVLLILTSHFEDGEEIPNPPLKQWFQLNSSDLASKKEALLARSRTSLPKPTPPYERFMYWLIPMARAFSRGMYWQEDDKADPNDETLGGNVTFDKMDAIFKIQVEGG